MCEAFGMLEIIAVASCAWCSATTRPLCGIWKRSN